LPAAVLAVVLLATSGCGFRSSHPVKMRTSTATLKEATRDELVQTINTSAEKLKTLKATPDGDGSLLDHSLILYGSGMSNSNVHNHSPLPILVAGGAAGKLKGGRHVKYPNETPLANLHVAMMNKLGVPAEKFADKKIAIIDDKSPYGKGLADETRKALHAVGFKEKLFESFNRGEIDFSAIVSRLKRENIDLVYVGGYPQEAGLILRQMREQGLKTVLMAGDALFDRTFASITGPDADGALFTFGPDPRNNPAARTVVEQFKASNIDPEGYTLHSYAAIQLWAQAVAKAGSTDARKVMDTIKAGEWDTVVGKLSFDAKGDIKQTGYVLWKWDGKGNAVELAPGKGQ
jgi:hypothetical protein